MTFSGAVNVCENKTETQIAYAMPHHAAAHSSTECAAIAMNCPSTGQKATHCMDFDVDVPSVVDELLQIGD